MSKEEAIYKTLQQLRQLLSEEELGCSVAQLWQSYRPLPPGWKRENGQLRWQREFADTKEAGAFISSILPQLAAEAVLTFSRGVVQLQVPADAELPETQGLPPSARSSHSANGDRQDKEILEQLLGPSAVQLADGSSGSRWLSLSLSAPLRTGTEPQKRLRVPIASIGRWERNGEVIEFTAEKFQQIIDNFERNELGFAPPLFLGHQSNLIMVEGAPAVGFLEKLEVEDNVLYGWFEVVDDAVYEAVRKGQYRHASAEVVLEGARSKRDGREIGALLLGVALTNRPFVPDLPFVQAFSEQRIGCTGVDKPLVLTWNLASAGEESMEKTPVERRIQELTETNLRLQQQQELLVQQLSETTQALKEATQRIQALEKAAQEAEQKLKKQTIEADVAFLKSLTLPQELKAKYIELAEKGALGEEKQLLFEALRMQSEATRASALVQHGSNAVENLTEMAGNNLQKALTDIIARNHELLKQRQQQQPLRGNYIL